MRALALLAVGICGACGSAAEPILSPKLVLERETFWDNRDWDWYAAHIPLLDCPDRELQTTYYYRWELLTKHLTYGSPVSGYSFTEFIDRPFWSGAYGAISCPAGHQLYEARWLRDPQFARDYARYWFRTPGAQPRNYSTWLADAVWAVHQVHPDRSGLIDLLPDLQRNHEGWEKRHFVPEVGLFWQTGHDDGMEFNINSRQTRDILRGAPGYRPTLNSYLWADALAIARVTDLAGQKAIADQYRAKAAEIKKNLQQKLWDPQRQFFFHLFQRDEEAEGFRVRALTRTHETGRHAGSPYGRELIGYVPWQFELPDADRGYEVAWKKLLDQQGFSAPYGPTTVEKQDPMFLLKKTCCWWSGQSWPYATSQTLKAMANLLQSYPQKVVTRSDYYRLLSIYSNTHRKGGRPYLAEACHPDTGSFEGHDGYNHSEHYFHSSFNDLIITGLMGVRPRDDQQLELKPLVPEDWSYFALTGIPYRGYSIDLLWDRDGKQYKRGTGFRVFADGQEISRRDRPEALIVALPDKKIVASAHRVNFAVNNDGTYFPRLETSYSNPRTSPAKLNDGHFWYHRDPPNRWTCEGSTQDSDTIRIDFGIPRKIDAIHLYPLDDGKGVITPRRIELAYWDGQQWKNMPGIRAIPEKPEARRANRFNFEPTLLQKLQITLHHSSGGKSGLSEVEAWGDGSGPFVEPPHPTGNIAYNPGGREYPKASASYSDRFGGLPKLANDGRTNFLPTPTNRWTCYESPNPRDWLEIDFGQKRTFRRIELGIYDDRGGVQPPQRYDLEYWDGEHWKAIPDVRRTPEQPVGSQYNTATFAPLEASKVRIVFTHAGKARSGVTEVLIWNE